MVGYLIGGLLLLFFFFFAYFFGVFVLVLCIYVLWMLFGVVFFSLVDFVLGSLVCRFCVFGCPLFVVFVGFWFLF